MRKKKDRLDLALDRLYEAMKAGDRWRQDTGKPLIWGDTDWWLKENRKETL